MESKPTPANSRSAPDYHAIHQRIVADPRYQKNVEWGEARPGHPEGSVRAHIVELERNLARLRPRLSDDEAAKLTLLIHTHDTFKAEAAANVAIADPRSHASLARAFLAEFCDDPDLLAMTQYHDEPFALWRQVQTKGSCSPSRLEALLAAIDDWRLFVAFNIIDGCTEGKSCEPLRWWLETVTPRRPTGWTAADLGPAA